MVAVAALMIPWHTILAVVVAKDLAKASAEARKLGVKLTAL